ncbi:MAG TPA: hypothetical protein VF449_13180, partial [Parvibaculum sp.]
WQAVSPMKGRAPLMQAKTRAIVRRMIKRNDMIDFEDVKARALKKPEVRSAFIKTRAMRIATEAVQRIHALRKLSQSDVATAMGKP